MREFLNSEKIAAAPVIVGLGRDRVFLKELHFPPIAAHEEASLVRFQTGKEMAEAVDNYAIDYSYIKNGDAERHVMTVAGRRDIVSNVQKLCQAAQLKLHAITPRLFGMQYAMERATYPSPSPFKAKHLTVVLSVAQRWAELSFFRGDRLLQSQALANGPLLVNEIKRNLAVFQAQHAVSLDVENPECLYVFGDDPAMLQNLLTGQPLPVHLLDPLIQEPEAAAEAKSPASFAGAAGLAALWTLADQVPVNLAVPKRQSAPSGVTAKKIVMYGGAAAAAVLILLLMTGSLMAKRSEITRLTAEKRRLEEVLAANAQPRADVEAYLEWERTTVPWLDEFYDLAARTPHKEGFRINQLVATNVSSTGAKRTKDNNFIGKINLAGVEPQGGGSYFNRLTKPFLDDGHISMGRSRAQTQDFTMEVNIKWQERSKYTTLLVVPPASKAAAPAKKFAAPILNQELDDDGGKQ